VGRAARQLFRGRDPDRHRPLFTAVVALWLIKPEVPDRRRSAGLIIGFVWVIALLGIDLNHGPSERLRDECLS
jgi:hypothetical protein